MCQIFAGPSNQIRAALLSKPGLLDNLLKRNRDGLGAMYATKKNLLRTPKIVPKDLAAATAFLRQLPDDDRNLVIHFRMKTSGNIDHDNAHPFTVIDGEFAMTHNGILSYPTKSDPTMCDTRHYIRDVVRPQLELCPALAKSPAWLWLVGQEIGSNRFVLMDRFGEMSFVNKHTGYDFGDIWFANKYSFDPALLDDSFAPPPPKHWSGGTGPGKTSGYSGGAYGYWENGKFTPYSELRELDEKFDWDAFDKRMKDDKAGNVLALPSAAKTGIDLHKPSSAAESAATLLTAENMGPLDDFELEQLQEYLWLAVESSDVPNIRAALLLSPEDTIAMLFDGASYVPSVPTGGQAYSKLDEKISNALVDQDAELLVELVSFSTIRAQNVAEVIAYFGEWVDAPPSMTSRRHIDAAEDDIEDAVIIAKGSTVETLEDAIREVNALEKDLFELDKDDAAAAQHRDFLKEELDKAMQKVASLSAPDSPVTEAMTTAMERLETMSDITREVVTTH